MRLTSTHNILKKEITCWSKFSFWSQNVIVLMTKFTLYNKVRYLYINLLYVMKFKIFYLKYSFSSNFHNLLLFPFLVYKDYNRFSDPPCGKVENSTWCTACLCGMSPRFNPYLFPVAKLRFWLSRAKFKTY